MTKMGTSPRMKRIKRVVCGVVSAGLIVGAVAFGYSECVRTGWAPSIRELIEEPMAVEVTEHPWSEVDWERLQATNSEVVGWIDVPGTAISLPICQAPVDDPEKYLHVNVEGEEDGIGSAFVDAECTEGIMGGFNTAILAHHWHDGSMFSDVANYSDEDWAREHEVAYIQTPEAVWTVKLASAEIIRGTELAKRCTFDDIDDFQEWYKGRMEGAEVVLDERMPDKIVSLVTCSYNYTPKNERTIAYFAVESMEPQR